MGHFWENIWFFSELKFFETNESEYISNLSAQMYNEDYFYLTFVLYQVVIKYIVKLNKEFIF